MSWHSIRGHDRVVDELRRASNRAGSRTPCCSSGRRGSASGPSRASWRRRCCARPAPPSALDPCEACPGCLQVEAETHPDFVEVARPEDKHELPIAVIRDLCDHFGLKPARGIRKVAILDDADDLNEEAANAFLKTLEEPPPGAVLILIGTSAEVQLQTIVSRCQVVRFDPLSAEDVAALAAGAGRRPATRRTPARLGGAGRRQPATGPSAWPTAPSSGSAAP